MEFLVRCDTDATYISTRFPALLSALLFTKLITPNCCNISQQRSPEEQPAVLPVQDEASSNDCLLPFLDPSISNESSFPDSDGNVRVQPNVAVVNHAANLYGDTVPFICFGIFHANTWLRNLLKQACAADRKASLELARNIRDLLPRELRDEIYKLLMPDRVNLCVPLDVLARNDHTTQEPGKKNGPTVLVPFLRW
ncbi:uncharacterized protein BDZ99DRAFT_235436 [Mytilinidion resinicola]|uniref:Uncharacterized protein n=1 Tax=Mytilinidion resinicola TaxID=574789 RepID=A0A6A6YZJ2_9PEZI|nr:uncharacterized protein BDZ99DRAFT_235436 [Mytilinidion resinicola]KAF2814346.1 hypothetical protein BDZ99DRAFT_235436 [Mytilinidion resinicola]